LVWPAQPDLIRRSARRLNGRVADARPQMSHTSP
jgi:hypothetical protein